MSTSQLLPPIKPSEAVALADLIFRTTQGRAWGDGLREQIADGVPGLQLDKLQPLAHTLIPGALGSNSFFVVVGGVSGDWLLHVAPTSAAAVPLFENALTIARARPAAEREIVIQAIPVEENVAGIVRTFYPQLLAEQAGTRDVWSFPAQLADDELWRSFPRRATLVPGIRGTSQGWQPYRSLLLSIWREGFVNILEGLTEVPSALEAEPYSRFCVAAAGMSAAQVAAFYERLKENVPRNFDFELDLSARTTLVDLEDFLAALRSLEVPVASIELPPATAPASGFQTHWKLEALP